MAKIRSIHSSIHSFYETQDKLLNARERFTIFVWIKSALINGLIKGVFLTLLISGIFLAYDFESFLLLYNFSLFSMWSVMIALIIFFILLEVLLTAMYQHSKDFWFVIIACYGYVFWYIGSWLIRV